MNKSDDIVFIKMRYFKRSGFTEMVNCFIKPSDAMGLVFSKVYSVNLWKCNGSLKNIHCLQRFKRLICDEKEGFYTFLFYVVTCFTLFVCALYT